VGGHRRLSRTATSERRHWRGGLATIVGLLILAGVLAVAVTRHSAHEQNVWFAATGVAIGGLALIAAVVGVYLALPGYRDLVKAARQHAVPTLRMQVRTEDAQDWENVTPDAVVRRPHGPFYVRVIVHNDGDAVLRWAILNIQVPSTCGIEVLGEDHWPRHFRVWTEGTSGELYPERATPCWFTAAERDFPPVHDFLYPVTVHPPGDPGVFPVAAVLDSWNAPREWMRIEVDTRAATD
jgi:hypothetical protein